jgi:hypothetical protein
MLYQLHLKNGSGQKMAHLLVLEHEMSLKESDSPKITHLLAVAYLLRVHEMLDDVLRRLYARIEGVVILLDLFS